MATNYRWKAETELWMSDPECWVWQYQDHMGVWITSPGRRPPPSDAKCNFRLVPRPWLEEPEKWEVWVLPKRAGGGPFHWRAAANQFSPSWDHRTWKYELRPENAAARAEAMGKIER